MEFSYNKLRGKIKEKFGTQGRFADALNISNATLSQKLNNATEFTQTEMLTAMHVLGEDLSSVDEYFFSQEVRESEQYQTHGLEQNSR